MTDLEELIAGIKIIKKYDNDSLFVTGQGDYILFYNIVGITDRHIKQLQDMKGWAISEGEIGYEAYFG